MIRSLLVALPLVGLLTCGRGAPYSPSNGDIVFQTSRSSQSLAIQVATKSPYSHIGIVYLKDGEPYVFEAASQVKSTPLPEWIARGEGGHFVAKRLADSSSLLTKAGTARMLEVARQFEGKKYDPYFEWDDDRIYCSELVWKIYKQGLDIEIGKLETLGDFDLGSAMVKEKMKERWGAAPPLDETVISPATMFRSKLLVEVHSE